MKNFTIRWEQSPDDRNRTTYYVNDVSVGVDDAGIDRIVEMLTMHEAKSVTLKVRNAVSLGGDSLMSALPFGERFHEISDAAGESGLTYDFF